MEAQQTVLKRLVVPRALIFRKEQVSPAEIRRIVVPKQVSLASTERKLEAAPPAGGKENR